MPDKRRYDRLKIGGSTWNEQIWIIRQATTEIRAALNQIVDLAESQPNSLFLNRLALKIAKAAVPLSKILEALDVIQNIVEKNADEE